MRVKLEIFLAKHKCNLKWLMNTAKKKSKSNGNQRRLPTSKDESENYFAKNPWPALPKHIGDQTSFLFQFSC